MDHDDERGMKRDPMVDLGWLMFAGSGLSFLIVALQNGDRISAAGCVMWLAGIVFFLMSNGPGL